jgi:poly-gamma-glutamate synthesis protein (capsule biosynthesis protein)
MKVKPAPSVSANAGASPQSSPSEQPQVSDDQLVTMRFVGDTIFSGRVKDQLVARGYDYPYKELLADLQGDLTIANLESPVTTKGVAQIPAYAYQSTPDALPAFQKAGFDLVTLANEHVMDYGAEGLLDSFTNLNLNGVAHVGAGQNAKDAYAPTILTRNGVKVAFLGVSAIIPRDSSRALDATNAAPNGTPGIADLADITRVTTAIQDAKKQADLVVVLPHWGIEHDVKVTAEQTALAHQMIDAGADLIVGNHPHVMQALEKYKGKWIAYSLGNFLYTTNATDQESWRSSILKVTCKKKGVCALRVVPFRNDFFVPRAVDQLNAGLFYDQLMSISNNITVESNGRVIGE